MLAQPLSCLGAQPNIGYHDRYFQKSIENFMRTQAAVKLATNFSKNTLFPRIHPTGHRISPGHLRDISGTSPGHLRDISGTSPGHLRDISGHLRDISGTSPGQFRVFGCSSEVLWRKRGLHICKKSTWHSLQILVAVSVCQVLNPPLSCFFPCVLFFGFFFHVVFTSSERWGRHRELTMWNSLKEGDCKQK